MWTVLNSPSNTLWQYTGSTTTSCEELTHWKRLWCWEGLGAGGEGDDRGWDGWMASQTRWMWVWVNSRSWWWTGRPGMLRFMGSQRVGHDWATELNWTTNHGSSHGHAGFSLRVFHLGVANCQRSSCYHVGQGPHHASQADSIEYQIWSKAHR